MEKFSSFTTIYMGKASLRSAVAGATRVFVVSDAFMVSSGKISYVTDCLDSIGVAYAIFSDVQADPDIETIAAGMSHLIEFKPDHETAKRYAKIAALCGISTSTVRQSALNVIRTIRSWTKNMDVPSTIRAAGVSETDFRAKLSEMADDAVADGCLATTPRTCTKVDILQIFENAYIGKLP